MTRERLLQTLLAAAMLQAAFIPAAAQTQDADAIAMRVEQYLRAQTGGNPRTMDVSIQPPRVGHLPACSALEPRTTGGLALRSRMTIKVDCKAPQPWSVYVQAVLSIQGRYYVSQRTIQAGEALSPYDLDAREGDILRLPRDAVLDPAQAIGYVAAQRIPAGEALKTRSLRNPDTVARGQTVRTEVRGNGFVATGEGQALESGPPGSYIQVKARSGEIIGGVVVNAHTVRIMM